METVEQIISDDEINTAWGNANFASDNKREIIANALLKYASGYATGYVIEQICANLGLIGITRNLTKIGKKYLFAAYNNEVYKYI